MAKTKKEASKLALIQAELDKMSKQSSDYGDILFDIKKVIWGRDSYEHEYSELPKVIEALIDREKKRLIAKEAISDVQREEIDWLRHFAERLAKLPEEDKIITGSDSKQEDFYSESPFERNERLRR